MKLKLWLRRLSVSAPQMTVKTARGWPVRMFFAALWLVIGALAGIGLQNYGRALMGLPAVSNAELDRMREELAALRLDHDRLATSANSAESELSMERAAGRMLTAQIRTLETEVARLKEDLAFFERLLPAGSQNASGSRVSIRAIAAEVTPDSQLQYRLLIMQGGKHATDFEGTLRLSVGVIQNGRPTTLNFPSDKPGEINEFKLGFRHYQRLEGTLTLPADVSPRSLQATVLERGQVRAQQTVNL